jgi:hypothetical protein
MPDAMKEIDEACKQLGECKPVYVLTAHFYKHLDNRVFLLGVFTTEEQAITCRDTYILNGTLNDYSDKYDQSVNESDFDIHMITMNNYWKVEL